MICNIGCADIIGEEEKQLKGCRNTRMDSVRGGDRSEDWIDFYRESAKERTGTKRRTLEVKVKTSRPLQVRG
jgi:hypothetical protein